MATSTMHSGLIATEQVEPSPAFLRFSDIPTMFLFGVRVDNLDEPDALQTIRGYLSRQSTGPARQVFFTNVHSIHLALRDRTLLRTVNRADLALPDGSGLSIAGRVLGHPVRANLNGTDLIPKLLRHAEAEGWTVYLFGAQTGVLDRCRERLAAQFPRLQIVGCHHGYCSPEEEQTLLDEINATQPDLLLVALGSPRQETWIARHAPSLNVRVCCAVGGLFDFVSGARKRAPRWMRRFGIEWAFRFLIDPKAKWDRFFIEIPLFLALVLATRVAPGWAHLLMPRKVRR
ncbi:MAG: WecB/TagA/CpsF family glycosyltransferase [Candidatus Latescibacteria bacterium]|nr:WecB/TagA/CpsF family glycosyltransferase [Candidatus Latescibacterota bacterium]